MRHFHFALFLLLALVPMASRAGEKNQRPNIVWINCEDISPALGCYGDAYAKTPNLDALAKSAILYQNAFATAPICAPSRSCLITGMYATSLGTQHLRSEVALPESIRTLPHYLRLLGYFCTNFGKTDYNFSPEGIWDYWRNDTAPWRKRKDKDQPFFCMFTLGVSHAGRANRIEQYKEAVKNLDKRFFHDPHKAKLPPFFPNTQNMREIWAHYYDTISVMDQQVGEILNNLKKDGLWENTIVFFFSDHGFGLPRYKRWLTDSGLRVPLLVRIPDGLQTLANTQKGTATSRLISFVDFAPTVLSLAGGQIPKHMQGTPFLGQKTGPPRQFVFGARSRADDMYDVARAVHNGRYIYIRQYMPHLPHFQGGEIYSDRLRSHKELRRAFKAGELSGPALALWDATKPNEELYDLKTDPYEIKNLAKSPDPEHQRILQQLRKELHSWIKRTRDTGFLHESEMHIRAKGSTIYEMAQDKSQYDLEHILDAAELMGNTKVPNATLGKLLTTNRDSGVRYWAATCLLARKSDRDAVPYSKKGLHDKAPCVQITCAEALCHSGHEKLGLPILSRWVQDDRPTVALHAARTIFQIGNKAKPLVPVIRKVIDKNKAKPGSRLRYKDFNYAAFTTWSLEWSLRNCGIEVPDPK